MRKDAFVLLATWLLILTACGSSDGEAFTGDEALAVSDAYVAAFNSGDAEAVLALFTPNVALSDKYTGMSDSFEEIDRAFFDQHLAWSIAQGTTFTSPECAVTDDSAEAEVTVSCEFGWLDAAENAASAPPVPTVLTMVVTPDGISGLAFEYPPEFGVASFDNWLLINHRKTPRASSSATGTRSPRLSRAERFAPDTSRNGPPPSRRTTDSTRQ